MSMKARIVRMLLHVYPAAWRAEYESELGDILLRRSVGPRVVADVLWNGIKQRVRVTEPAMLCGLAAMLIISIGLGLNIAGLPTFGHGLPAFLQDSWKLFPTLVVTPLGTELYVLWLIVCGCWTVLRESGLPSRPGPAAMKVTALAGTPIMFAGLLMLLGILDVMVVRPGDVPASSGHHGFTYTYYTVQHHAPSPVSVLVAPLFKIPESWLWGVVGGRIGRGIVRARLDRASRA
jgi:hypothetical protein